MIETKRMWLREATADDIDQIIALEEHKDNRDFLWIGTRQEHQDEIDDPNHILLIFEKKQDRNTVGYALIRLNPRSEIFELRRIAISEKNRGYGREATACTETEFCAKTTSQNGDILTRLFFPC